MTKTTVLSALALVQLFLVNISPATTEINATEIVRSAWDHWRGLTSYSVITMTIHRPDWERAMTMRVWTEGQDRSLVRVTAPKKDVGNATLLVDKSMWTYSPRVNRIIKVPSSMMNQSWMGSDFTNNDVTRSADILEQYDHNLLEQYESDGKTVSVIEAIPHEDASVVWGREVLHVREDHIVIVHEFYDQAGELVKGLRTLETTDMGNRTVASLQRMQNAEGDKKWTQIEVSEAQYDIKLDKQLFSRANLRNPRE
jgi:outer membrane lipoprotein-sorting protein